MKNPSITKWVLSIYFKAFPVLAPVFAVTEVILYLGSLLNAYILALVTDRAIRMVSDNSTSGIKDFLPIVTLIIGTYLVLEIARVVNTYSLRIMSFKGNYMLRVTLANRLHELGIQNLEKPEISNLSQRFTEEIGRIFDYLRMLIEVIANMITFIIAGLVLVTTVPFVALAFTVVMTIQFFFNQKFTKLLWVINRETTEQRRKSNTSLGFLTEPEPLKELVLSDGRKFLLNKVRQYIDWIVGEISSIRQRWAGWQIAIKILDATVFGYGIVVILQRLVDRVISIGQLTFEIRSLRIFSDSFNNFTGNLVGLRESAIRIADIQEIFTKYTPEENGEVKMSKFTGGIEFDNVSFRYPDAKKMVLKNIDLKIKSGEKVAIVGENGAGKTTLVKLICRLYRVNEGQLKIDNTNINNLEIATWYRNLSMLFQDYNTYTHLTVKENVEIDSSDKIVTSESILKALKQADAGFVKNYPDGINQILSERYKGGIRPSTGQWQKIAIARVFHRDAPVLILDEPTASIDAVAEAQIFDNIYKFAKGKTVIIISHRFSTVRHADRIMVLDKGEIIEEGNHEELLAKDGKYAHAFKLQAKGYA